MTRLVVTDIRDGIVTLSARNTAPEPPQHVKIFAALHMVQIGPTLDITDYVLSGGRMPPVKRGSLDGPDLNRPTHSSGEVRHTSTPRLTKDDTT
jgi:hypothetical protein